MTAEEGNTVTQILHGKLEPIKAHTALLRVATFTQDPGLKRAITIFNKALLNPGVDYLECYNALTHYVDVSRAEAKHTLLGKVY